MYYIDTADANASEPTRPAAGVKKFFSNALQTIVPDWFLNMVQKELGGVVEGAGLTLDKTNDAQLLEAIKLYCDPIDIVPTGGTVALENTTTTPANTDVDFIYNISEFTGIGINTDAIRWICVSFQANSGAVNGSAVGHITMPDGSFVESIRANVGAAATQQASTIVTVPIKKGQTTFTIRHHLVNDAAGDITSKILHIRQQRH